MIPTMQKHIVLKHFFADFSESRSEFFESFNQMIEFLKRIIRYDDLIDSDFSYLEYFKMSSKEKKLKKLVENKLV